MKSASRSQKSGTRRCTRTMQTIFLPRNALFRGIDDEGGVAFAAPRRAGGSGIFSATARGVTPLIDPNGLFESFRGALINRAGLAAFYATPGGGRLGVFSGPDPVADRSE